MNTVSIGKYYEMYRSGQILQMHCTAIKALVLKQVQHFMQQCFYAFALLSDNEPCDVFDPIEDLSLLLTIHRMEMMASQTAWWPCACAH